MTESKNIGQKGEEIASAYLENKGFSILCRNWHFRHKEVDIIATLNKEIIFVEVKTRWFQSLVKPLDSVGKKKQRDIIEAANGFIVKNNIDAEVRFDIITIVNNPNGYEIEHIENAFYPGVHR